MDIGQRRIDRSLARVGFWRQAHIECSLSQVNATLGIANDLCRLKRGMCHQKCLRVGVANILRSLNHNTTSDKLGVLPRVDHAREPIDRGIGIATAHRLNKRTDDVVVHVAVFVVRKATTRVGNLYIIHGNGITLSRRRRWRTLGIGTRDGNLARKLKRRERRASVTRCQRADGLNRILIGRELAVQTLRRLERTLDKHGNIIVLEVLKLHHATAREQRRVDLKVRVLRRGANHNDGTVLNRMQQGILLRLGEAVNLIDKKNGTAVVRIQARLGLVDHAAQVLHGACHGADLDKLALGMVGDNVGQRRLARTGRPVQNHARKHVVLDRGT